MGELSWRKLKEYIPAMLLTNLSTLLLITVDGVVAGHLVGADALSSINIFFPVSTMIGAATMIAAIGVSTGISTAIGKNDQVELDRVKGVALRLMIYIAVFVSVAQIPLTLMIIKSYGLSDEMHSLTMQYAIGIMLCSPLGVISTVGTYQLQIAGKMRVLVRLSAMEGITNLIFDVFFMGVLKIGVGGAGYGTLCANLLRCTATVFYISRYTDMYKSSVKKVSAKELISMGRLGIPDFSNVLASAIQSYFLMRVILAAFGTAGGVIKGVASLCYSLCNVLNSGVTGSMRPLMGLYAGADDKVGLRILMRQGRSLITIGAGLITLLIELRPDWFFALNGIHDIPDGGELSIRLFALYLVVSGYLSLQRLYLVIRKDSRFATLLNLISNFIQPVFAYLLWKTMPAPFIFLSYLLTYVLLLAMAMMRYRKWIMKDDEEFRENGEDIVLYMTVDPEDAVEASRKIRRFAHEHGINPKIAYRVALSMEEMVAYVEEKEITGLGKKVKSRNKDNSVSVEIIVRFKGKESAVFVSMDDGRCISLDSDEEESKLITDNYGLLKKLAKSAEYQYILDMNYTRLTF